MDNLTLLCVIACFTLVASFVTVNWVRLYLSKQLIDIPNARSSHKRPTPRGGGLGFLIAFLPSILAYNFFLGTQMPTIPLEIWGALLPLILIGLIDDWKDLSASLRYCIQLSVAALLVHQLGVFPQFGLENLGTLGAVLAFLITVIGVTASMNFYNFMDGLDGLVGGCCIIQSIYFAIYLEQPSLLLLTAALSGFLFWNWSPAKIFMGDAGSTFLGAVTPALLLIAAQPSENHSTAESWASLVVTLPLILDAIYTIFVRFKRGENIFQAHRSHLYQRLNQSGFSHAQVAGSYVCTTTLSAIGVLWLGLWGASLSLFAIILQMFWAESLIKSYSDDKDIEVRIPSSSGVQDV